MRRFYDRYTSGSSVADSLVEAQRWLKNLDPREAAGELRRSQQDIRALGFDEAISQRASIVMEYQIRTLDSMPATERPYSLPDSWGAFALFGPP
jgi:CHAT domain-containing protein